MNTNSQSLRIIVLGYVVRGPLGGMVWSNLQYLQGLAQLGHDVWFVEDSDDYPSCYDPVADSTSTDPAYGLQFAQAAFERIGFGERWMYYDAHTSLWHGPGARDWQSVLHSADLLLNLCGVNPIRPWLQSIKVRALVDEDPAFTQIRNLTDEWSKQRTLEHNVFFTFAKNFGKPRCTVPDDGIAWRATHQPLLLDSIRATPGVPGGNFTTVMQWNSYPPREFGNRSYGMKSDSFEAYVTLPQRVPQERLELGLGASTPIHERLKVSGWRTVDARIPTRDPWIYQDYVSASKAEFSVAKQGYVTSRSGWFSERSVTYMASGRPVVIQDAGFTDWLPCGVGILPFSTPDEAVAAMEDASARYDMHCRAARELAEQYFDSRKVLGQLVEDCFSSQAP